MANTFNHHLPDIAQLTARLVGADFNLAALISRDVEADFVPGRGNTVRIPVPAAIATRSKGIYDKTTALVADELTEKGINVVLQDHLYNLAVLADGDVSLSILDYGKQVLAPQARAISAKVEALVAAAMSATPATASISYDAAAPARAFTAARRELRDNGVHTGARLIAAVGSNVYADLLDAPLGTFDADGKVRGFEVTESTRLDADDIVAFVPSAFSLVVRAPQVPNGATHGASVFAEPAPDEPGAMPFAIRVINDYDSNVAADRSLVSTFAAVTPLPLAVDNEDGTISLVDHGGVVRIATGE